MLRRMVPLLLALAFAAVSSAQEPVIEIRAVTPDPARRLAPKQALYVHFAYAYSQPLRFQARGFRNGEHRDQMHVNTSPVYPAGQGDAVVWLSGDPGARVDEIRIRVTDREWNVLAEITFPFAAEWHAGPPSAPTAPWAAALIEAQNHLPSVHENPPRTWWRKLETMLLVIAVPIAFLSVTGYPVLQILALIKLRGPLRPLSALPLSFMLPVYAFSIYALTQNSNLWPMYAIFASPVALIITLVIFIIGLRRQRAVALLEPG